MIQLLQASAPPAGQGCPRGSSSLSLGSLESSPSWQRQSSGHDRCGYPPLLQSELAKSISEKRQKGCVLSVRRIQAAIAPRGQYLHCLGLWSPVSEVNRTHSSSSAAVTQRGLEELWRGTKYPGDISLGDLSSQFTATSIRISRYQGT